MLPGTEYTPDRIVHAIRRRAWRLVVTPLIGLAAAIAIGLQLPDRFRSETVIMLEPQRIPDEYVKSMGHTVGNDRVATLENQIRSRSRLERIIADLDLYPSLRRTAPMQDVVEQMNKDITVDTDKASVSVRVAYVSGDPRIAQQVAERLSSSFIRETLQDRENLAEETNGFLDVQLEDAKRQLIEHEKKLEQYRTQYGQELPSQSTTNLQAIQNAQTQLQASLDASARERERRLMLERQAADLENELQPEEPVVQSPELGKGTTAEQLAAARALLPVLLTRAKPDHPDVKSLRRTIRDLEAKLETENAQNASKPPNARRPTAAELQKQRRVRDLKDQIADIDNQLAARQSQETKLRTVIGDYQSKLNAIPKRESELVELSRDYTTLQATYQSLLSKRQDAKIAADLERKNIGPQFRILDSPKVPERPFTPNRPLIDLGGMVGGLLFGLLTIAFSELRDSTFRFQEDVEVVLQLPVLAVMPVIAASPIRRVSFVVAGIAAAAVVGAAVALWAGSMHLPFELTPNPKYLYLSRQHREALSNLEYGLLTAKGITVLIGEAGTGKTTLLHAMLASQRCRNISCVFVSNPTLTREEFYELLAQRFALTGRAIHSKAAFLDQLETLLREHRAAGLSLGLIIDEAQSLSQELLEEIRLLANSETSTQKLLPLVLVGQPELRNRLNEPGLRQLKQRITLRCAIAPLGLEDTIDYIASRIRTAGGEASTLFTRDAIALIHERSRGIPRMISVLCDNALLTGCGLGQQPVNRAVVLEVVRDFDLEPPSGAASWASPSTSGANPAPPRRPSPMKSAAIAPTATVPTPTVPIAAAAAQPISLSYSAPPASIEPPAPPPQPLLADRVVNALTEAFWWSLDKVGTWLNVEEDVEDEARAAPGAPSRGHDAAALLPHHQSSARHL